MKKKLPDASGFTLVEILISLFIFSILSTLLMAGLRTVMNVQSSVETKATRIRQLQMSLLIMSRDIEQAVNRSIVNASGKSEAAFVGTPTSFTLTHTGQSSFPGSAVLSSSMQRTEYIFQDRTITRMIWTSLDQAPKAQSTNRQLIADVADARFEYLDDAGHFNEKWPTEQADDSANSALPKGIRIHLSIDKWGEMSQFYLIPVHESKNAAASEEDSEEE